MKNIVQRLSRKGVLWSLLGVTSALQLLYLFWRWIPFSFGANDPNHATVKLLMSLGLFFVVLVYFLVSGGGSIADEYCLRISKISKYGLIFFVLSVLSGFLLIGIVLVPFTVAILGVAFFFTFIGAWGAKVE